MATLDSSNHDYPPTTPSSSSSSQPDTISFLIHTETSSITDLRLQVSHDPTPSSSSKPLRPAYFRERMLSEDNEIVDNIVDASTGKVRWSIHRPTRGWYLHLRSPALPPNTAISLRAAEGSGHDSGVTPLTFAVNSKVRGEALGKVKARIDTTEAVGEESRGIASSSGAHVIKSSGEAADEGEGQDVALAATGRENPKTASAGHARRRSGATGSGTHPPTSKRLSTKITSSPMIPELDDGDADSPSKPSAPRLTIPRPSPTTRSASGDRPYSPTHPSSPFPPPIGDQASRTNTFLLTDGNPSTGTSKSWTRWACSLLPSEIRPSLTLDTDKSFSLYWLDPPSGTCPAAEGVEVAKFQDQSGRWMWNSSTKGKLTLQTSAMQAIGLEMEFWITAALAYVQFLEDKDAYDAARDA